MSVYYNYIVKTDDEQTLANLLKTLMSDFPIDEIEIFSNVGISDDRTSIEKILGFLSGRRFKEDHVKKENKLYRRLGLEESVIVDGDYVVMVENHRIGIPNKMSDTDWYFISTTIDHSDGNGYDKIKFGESLKSICSRICVQADVDSDLDRNRYFDFKYLKP